MSVEGRPVKRVKPRSFGVFVRAWLEILDCLGARSCSNGVRTFALFLYGSVVPL